GYNVYRGGTQIATVTSGTTYQNTGLSASTAYSYTVAAYDAAGNISAQSTSASATTAAPPAPPPDTTAPTLSIASPTGGNVSGIVTIDVSAFENVAIWLVGLRVNEQFVAAWRDAPYRFAWESRAYPNGLVSLQAIAFDVTGKELQSSIVIVN